jgi:hypothetical protein
MRKIYAVVLFVGLLLAGTLGMMRIARGQDQVPPAGGNVIQRETDGDNVRQILAPDDVAEPSITTIDSPTPYCFQPDAGQDVCYMNWASMHVEGTPANMDAMTVTIDAVGVVARYQAFFQDTMDVSHEMNATGFRLPCGPPGAGGDPNLGNAYDWTIRARDSGGNTASNHGRMFCPPFTP